jgi:O-antigen/teichoic acid export membrane protein
MISNFINVILEKFNLSDRYKKVLLTGATTGFVKFFIGIINLITVPLTLNYLGSERYGLWMSISSVISLMSFSDLGLGNGLLNEIASAKGRNSLKDAQVAVASTFFILIGLAAVLFVIFIFVYQDIQWYNLLNVKSEKAISETSSTVLMLFSIFLINIPLGIIQRIHEGYQEGYIFQFWLILGSVLSLIALLVCVHFQAGLPYLVLAYSIGQIVSTFLNSLQLFIFYRPELKPKFDNFSSLVAKKLIKNGLVFLSLTVFALIANTTDNLIIANVNGIEFVAGYEIVRKLFYFSMITAFFITPLWPAFGEAIAVGDVDWIIKTRNTALKISLISGLIITTPLFIFGKKIIALWIDQSYVPSWSLLFGFFVYITINNYIGVMSTMLNSSKYANKQILPLFVTCILSVLFKFLLAKEYGVSGVIWGTILSWSIGFAIPAFLISNNIIKELSQQKNNANVY